MLPAWKNTYSVNHTELDAQHKELFRLAQEVYMLPPRLATKEAIRGLFGKFFSYMKKHFEEEEAYMEAIGFPSASEHKAYHEKIVAALTKTLQQSHTLPEIQMAMKKIVKVWLVEHILVKDMEYERWRKEKYHKEARAKGHASLQDGEKSDEISQVLE
jgi:hemerythrin